MTTKNIYEVFDEVAAAATEDDKRLALIKNDTPALRLVLRAAFHPNIKFVFTEPVPYKRSDVPVGLGESTLHKEIWRIYLFEDGNPRVSPNLTLERKFQLLTQILESLETREAEVYMNMILKDLKVDGLTRELVMSVYPGLI